MKSGHIENVFLLLAKAKLLVSDNDNTVMIAVK